MPPKKGIVKSGNAGNSTKATKSLSPQDVPDGEKPLFPPGSKFPLSLLHERCQKSGWEKPVVDSRKLSHGWSFTVTLARLNKKTSQRETVRMEPHPPHVSPSALEARHWGATYALYRFCNGIQLNRVLPPGPRDYWNELANEHKNAPLHMAWMYNADPFAAQKEVDERQVKAAKKREDKNNIDPYQSRPTSGPASHEFSSAPEVKMAVSLRESVENAIKQGITMYPEVASVEATGVSEGDISGLEHPLRHLGFTPVQIRNATSFLSQPSQFASSLLGSSLPLEAAIEFLILSVPECDLPQRFLPTANSSNPFITSAHSGVDDLKRRWVEDKAVKEAGWPLHAVRPLLSVPRLLNDWVLLILTLNQRLIGEEWTNLLGTDVGYGRYDLDPEEIEALGAHFVEPTQLVMPLFSAPINVHILTSSDHSCPRYGCAPMFLTSTSVPAYVRLHLLSQIMLAMRSKDFIEQGEGFCMAVMRFLEEEWAKIEASGPPDMSTVLKHLTPPPTSQVLPVSDDITLPAKTSNMKNHRRNNQRHNQQRSSHQIKLEFEALCQDKKYIEMLASRKKLPAFAAKEKFLQSFEKSRVVVVVGETGCGKTTQLPQFILDSLILSGRGSLASILVTQPRRISAISVATRVSSERLDDGSVGYAIRGESKQGEKTKLLFCTTGVVLRRLGSGDTLEGVSHVIVDEVHERSIDGDFLLLELRELLKSHPTLKVVLMSATINHETFRDYFDGAPLLTIPGFTHPVTDRYLEDIISSINYRSPSRPKKVKDDSQEGFWDELQANGLDQTSIATIQSIVRSDRIDFQLVAAVVDHIVSTQSNKCGGILIFLPGVQEIRQCIDAVRTVLSGSQADIFPLHANLSTDEQNRVFRKTSNWKIIAATNVAETSITIDDVIYVIDCGKVKETQYDPETSLSRLLETWVTLAAARQRRGRAGRTQPGICYKLYTRRQESKMGKFPVPEILRVPLESISLTVKVMREDEDVKLFLSRAIDPPKTVAMEKAWSILEEIGAVDLGGCLTPLGRHIAMLPVDIRLAKMLVLGAVFQCLGPVLTIAASLSSKPLFLSPMDKRDEANRARARFSTAGSDLLTDLKAYNECAQLSAAGKAQGAIKAFCEDNFISPTTIRDITTLRQDFLSSLADIGFIPFSSTPSTPALNVNSDNTNLIKAVIVGGLWPRVARVKLPESAVKFDKVQAGTIQRENTAKEFKIYDVRDGRVFLHPGSVLFGEVSWKAPFLVYFNKYMSSKVFLRDATEIPLYALLLFGGRVSVNHVAGGLMIGNKDNWIKVKAWPRIGILVNHLRRLLDAQLQLCLEEGDILSGTGKNPVLDAIMALLTHDGLSE